MILILIFITSHIFFLVINKTVSSRKSINSSTYRSTYYIFYVIHLCLLSSLSTHTSLLHIYDHTISIFDLAYHHSSSIYHYSLFIITIFFYVIHICLLSSLSTHRYCIYIYDHTVSIFDLACHHSYYLSIYSVHLSNHSSYITHLAYHHYLSSFSFYHHYPILCTLYIYAFYHNCLLITTAYLYDHTVSIFDLFIITLLL
jgi:hypothetical protein